MIASFGSKVFEVSTNKIYTPSDISLSAVSYTHLDVYKRQLMAIDLFDPITLSAMVRRLPDTPQFLKNMFFKNRMNVPTTRVAFDLYKGCLLYTSPAHPLDSQVPRAQVAGVPPQ